MTVTTTPAPARTDRPTAATTAPGTGTPAARREGSRPLAAALLGAPLLLAASIALHPDDTHGVEHTLEAVGGSEKVLWTAIHLLEPAAWLLLGVALLLALPRMAGARGGTLLKVAGVLAAIGFPALSLIVYSHGEAFSFMAATEVDPATYAPLFEQFEVGFPMAALPSLLGKVGLLLAVVGLVRARTVPVWAALLLLLPVVMLGSGGAFPLIIGLGVVFVPLLVTFAFCARRIATVGGPALGGRE